MSPRVWFITGCSSGFGQELALEVLSRGDTVIATARNKDRLKSLQDAGASTMELDVTATLDELSDVASRVVASHGRLDVLVNNAGYGLQGTVEEITPEETRAQFESNVFGLLNVTRAFLPYLRSQKSGVIANVSSIAAWRGSPGLGIYAASKWAASAINETLHHELAEFGIRVVSIEPGYFRSKFLTLGNALKANHRLSDYNGTAARRNEEKFDLADQSQPGSVEKGAKVIVDVVTQTGCAAGKAIPMRLILGSDAYGIVVDKCESTLALIEEWKDVSRSTDHEKLNSGA